MLKDVRVALRLFARKPAFAVAVVVILALGIAVNITVFNLAWGLLYRPLPFSDPERLVRVWGESRDGRSARLAFSIPKYEYFLVGQRSFSGVAVDVVAAFTLTGNGEALQVIGRRVSANYFDVLGIRVIAGRGFRPDEEETGGVTIVTQAFWRDRLGGAPDAIGRAVTLDGAPYTIVGIAPVPLAADGAAEVYVTRPYDVGISRENLQRGVSFMRLSGRLRDAVTLDQAAADMAVVALGYGREYAGNADADWTPRVVSIREDLSGTFRAAVTTLLWAVALVLLLACSNVANLLTSHFLARRRELAVRTALGASRWQVLRQCIVETTVLSTAGASLGLLLALQINELLPQLASNLPIEQTTSVPWAQLTVASVLALGVGILTGVHPGLQSARVQAFDLLRGARGSTRERHRFQEALVGVQVAVSLVLLFAAALLTESFRRVSVQDPGFDVENVVTAAINLPPRRYATPVAQNTLYERLRDELDRAPGVRSAAMVAGLPLSGALSRAPYARADRAVPLNQRPLGPTRSVTPGYFETMGIALKAGRDFTRRDDGEAPHVVILSTSTAQRLFPNEDPIGRVVLTGSQGGGIPVEIVGVVGDVRSLSLTQETEVELYRPFAQRPQPFAQIVVKGESSTDATIGSLRAVARGIDVELPLTQVATLDKVLGDSLGQRRLLMTLLGTFAVLAFVLSAVGIYAVVSSIVSRRTTEIGVRLALGANPSEVVRMVAGQGMRPVIAGALAGVMVLPWVSNRISEQIFEVSPFNPMVIGVVLGSIVVVAGMASVAPARRAARIDPILALRAD